MNYKTVSIVKLGICLLLLTLASPSPGDEAVAGNGKEGQLEVGSSNPITAAAMPESPVQLLANSSQSCLPHYGEPQFILRVSDADSYEPELTAGDFNGDGLDDVVIRRSRFGTTTTFPLEILLNDGNGSLILGTSSVISGTVPQVQAPASMILVADFNSDEHPDIFVPDQGMDAPPSPGYQNTLVLSVPGGKMVDATENLPQQSDFTQPPPPTLMGMRTLIFTLATFGGKT